MFDQPLLLEPLERPDHARVLLNFCHGMIAEMEFEDVVISDARFLHASLDELVVLLFINLAAVMVTVHAVDDTLEIIRLPRQTLEDRWKRIGAPLLGLVPVIDAGAHRP